MRRCGPRLLILVAMSAAGCVRRRLDGDVSIYSTAPWVVAAVALGATAAAAAGWFLRRRRKRVGYLLVGGGGALVLVTTVPGLALSRALVDAEHVEWNRGLRRFHFRFEDLAGIEHSVRATPFGRTTRDVHHLAFTTKVGETTPIQVEPGYLQDAIPEILRRAKDRGVPCTEVGP